MTPVSSDQPYPQDLRALTSLRIFLAIGVVLFHFQIQTDHTLGYSHIIERSRLAVDGFFMLSGFIMAHVYGPGVAAGTFSYRSFLVARIARLYPMHIVVLTGALIMVVAAALLGVVYDAGTYSVRGFFETVFLIHAWFPTDVGINWNGPTWSLSAEWFAYLTFPLFAVLALRLRRLPLVLLAIGVVAFVISDAWYRQTFGKVLPRAEDVMGIARVAPEFLIGMGLYGLGRKITATPLMAISGAVISTVVLLSAMHFSLDDRIIVALTAPVILSVALLAKAGCEGVLASRPLVFAGEVSFALYIVHMPVLVAWKSLVSQARGIDSGFTVSLPDLAGLVLAAAVVAVAMHLMIERPGRRWVRRWLGQVTAASAANAAPEPTARPARP
ncbi:acyltransferase [soil metagenome]